LKFIIILLLITTSYASYSCIVCHNEINKYKNKIFTDIHYENKMFDEIKEVSKKIDEPTCTICHGGNSKIYDIIKSHRGAPKNHFGALKNFIKNPKTDKTGNQKVCAQCHNIGSL